MRKYKVLKSDMHTPYQNFQMELGKKYICKNFDTDKNAECSNGFYATYLDGLPYSINTNKNNRVFECEVGGKGVIINQYKQRYETFELIREIEKTELKKLLIVESEKKGYNLYEACFPINPLRGIAKEITEKDIELLKKWDSVWASVGNSVGNSVWDSVWDSVRASVGDSVGASVWDSVRASVWNSVWASVWASVSDSVGASVRASVRASVWDSVGAYMSSLFPNVKNWKFIYHKKGENPFQSCIDLWRAGFVPSFDGETWRLHSGDDAKIVYEMKI